MGDTRTETPATTTRVHHHEGIVVVEVVGEIDMACESPVGTVLAAQLDQRPAGLVVDLTGIDFFGSAGIQLLVEAIERAKLRGVTLAVATDRRAVLRPLEITLVREVLDVHPTLADAIAAVRADDLPRERRVAHQ
ncbi:MULTISPECIES: STAS domain-containing protein [Saccharothrix]|uniref:STAS domain-containing protein n=1 Tax=Saccharothrix TaxID=2071 RepID=UPI0009392F17|nr:STAS domain-containing protein [Saccharothrix sp. CB00851]OKI35279.1 hypothetical protein A6A25_24370 [Saccharothrix sp. CB00851]